jgi:hypothetical protein
LRPAARIGFLARARSLINIIALKARDFLKDRLDKIAFDVLLFYIVEALLRVNTWIRLNWEIQLSAINLC